MTFVFFSSLSAGAEESIYLIGVLASLHIIETILAYFYGKFYITKFEIGVLVISFLSMIIWTLTDVPLYTIIINTLVDAFGMLSIAYKVYRFPETEDTLAWVVSDLMYIVNLFTISVWSVENALFTIVNVITGTLLVLLTFRKMSFFQKIYFHTMQFFRLKI